MKQSKKTHGRTDRLSNMGLRDASASKIFREPATCCSAPAPAARLQLLLHILPPLLYIRTWTQPARWCDE